MLPKHSPGFMVSRVVSHNMIKLYIVDLISSLCLEPFAYQVELSIADLKLHSVEDRPEPSVGYETRVALIFILEEGLD